LLGRSLRSLPRKPPAQFASPANLRFAFSGCQTVVNRVLGAICIDYIIFKIVLDNKIELGYDKER